MSKHPKIVALESERVKSDLPDYRVGDTITVQSRIIETGGKERLQAFTGTVIAKQGGGISETVSLHRVAYGEGMLRVFYINSPLVATIEVVRRGKVRRSKLNYLKGTTGKASKVKGRFTTEKAQAHIGSPTAHPCRCSPACFLYKKPEDRRHQRTEKQIEG